MFKLSLITSLVSLTWIASFTVHPNFVSFSSNVEFAPDFKVSYKCNNPIPMEGLHMETKDGVTTVNYGGLGRRRGLRTFQCN